jgi:GH35 family endo-1,4-beta-xylanase
MQIIEPPDTSMAHRLGTKVLTLRGSDGQPLADTDITVEQVNHHFLFGNIGFWDFGEDGEPVEEAKGDAQAMVDLFNFATLPFYLGRFEPEEGKPRTEELMTAAKWLKKKGMTLKGHPLVWHTSQPGWLMKYSNNQVEQILRKRIRREVGNFKGIVDTWDAINEVVIMSLFNNGANAVTPLAWSKGRMHMLKLAFGEAHATNPEATLLLNDFDLSAAYECLIEGALEAGVSIDAIGLQTHQHQGFRGEDQFNEICERFSRFGLPLHFTETSLVSGDEMPKDITDLNDYHRDDWPSTEEGEARQADQVVRQYRTLVAQPAVQAITYWGMSDRGAWLNAPIGFLRKDGSKKPSYDALMNLIKGEWWISPHTARTDEFGCVQVHGFAGDYKARYGGQDFAFTIGAQTEGDFDVRVA